MIETIRGLSPPQQLLFWMLVAVLVLLSVLIGVASATLIADRQKVLLQGRTLEAIRDLFKAMAQVNEYTVKKVMDAGKNAEEVKQVVKDVVSLVADSPSALSIPSVGVAKSKETRP